jgi:exodeoxyribonuclease-3
MKIATWNVNSINARLETVLSWFREANPDVACLQEIKTVEEKFPREPLEQLGYNIEILGQKSYNGVALLSKTPIEDVRRGLPGDDSDEHARYLEAVTGGATPIRVASIYLPNGNPTGSDKFEYKLAWFERLRAHAAELLKLEEVLVLTGDFNVIPTDDDLKNPPTGPTTRCTSRRAGPPGARSRPSADRRLPSSGRAAARLHLLGLPAARVAEEQRPAHRLRPALPPGRRPAEGVEIHKAQRAKEKPSDHVPFVTELDLDAPEARCEPAR